LSRRYGYRIRNGKAFIESSEAANIVSFFTLYAEGAAIKDAARSAGIKMSTGACRNMLSNRVYLGTDFYPQLVDADLFNAVQKEKEKRGAHLTGVAGAKRKESETVKTRFRLVHRSSSASHHATSAGVLFSTASGCKDSTVDDNEKDLDPVKLAELLYSQIVTVDPEPECLARKTQSRVGAWKGTVPYGFQKDERGRLQIHNSETEVVRRIFSDLASGKSMRTVARELNDDGLTTKRGSQWLEGTLRRMVWNPIYIPLLPDAHLFEEAGTRVREKFRGRRSDSVPSTPSVPVSPLPTVGDRTTVDNIPAVADIPAVDNHTDVQGDTVEDWIPTPLEVFHTDLVEQTEPMTAPVDPSTLPHDMLYHGYAQPGESLEPVEQYSGGVGGVGGAVGKYRSEAEQSHALYGKQCPFVRGHFLCPLYDPCPDCPALPVKEAEVVEKTTRGFQRDWFTAGCGVPVSATAAVSPTASGTSPPGCVPASSDSVGSTTVSNHALSGTTTDMELQDNVTESATESTHGGKQVVKIINARNRFDSPAHLRLTGRSGDGASKLTRVAAYARVSTDSEEQETSYEAQQEHYKTYINDSTLHPDWTFAGIYADEGISGTSTRNRTDFHRLISDCEDGKVDLVLVKSISRLARNTVDSLNTIRKLKDLGIGIIFEKEGINTLDAAGEVLITILSSLAQQESESISQNVRMGLQYRMQEGKGSLNTNRFLGYQKKPDSKYDYEIVASEADIVRRIYREFLDGYSPAIIARHLMESSIPSPAGKQKWYGETVRSILSNEKYCGDMLLQKYFVENCLTHKLVRNTGQRPQYFVEDHHDPVVPKAVFFQVQGELARRSTPPLTAGARMHGDAGTPDGMGALTCNEDLPFTGRVVCGTCNRAMRRFKRRSVKSRRAGRTSGDFHNGIAGKAGNNAATTVDNGSPAPVDNCGTADVHTGGRGTGDTGRAGTGEAGEAGKTVAIWRCYDRENQQLSKCGGRSVRESELEAAVVAALNRILIHRDELLTQQAGIWKGELKRIDALLEVNRERAMELEERLISLTALPDAADDADSHTLDSRSGGEVETVGNGAAAEAERLNAQLEDLTEQRNALLLERAEWANKEFRIRILLELADEMMDRRQRAWEAGKDSGNAGEDQKDRMEWMEWMTGTQGAQSVEDPACRDYDDFFRRTRMRFPGNVLNQEGDIVGFDKSLVIRYVDRVLVQEDGFEVRLRAGISIKV